MIDHNTKLKFLETSTLDDANIERHRNSEKIHQVANLSGLRAFPVHYRTGPGLPARWPATPTRLDLPGYWFGRLGAGGVACDSDFSLVFPGIGSPFTHSLYESLFCGCIPILPKSPLTVTGWVDRQNCLLFNDAESLIAAIDLALNVDNEHLRALRLGAQKAFKDNYEIESAASRLLLSKCKRVIFRQV